jgi:hypothetical protein
MMREQFINFLETTVVFLLLTNALGIFAAAYAVSLAHGLVRPDPQGAAQGGWLAFWARRLRFGG